MQDKNLKQKKLSHSERVCGENLRKCNRCREILDKKEFTKSVKSGDGVSYSCRKCWKIAKKIARMSILKRILLM
jgi:hypothetical protein